MDISGTVIRNELNKLITHHSLGQYDSLEDIKKVNRRLLYSRFAVVALFTVLILAVMISSPPFLIVISAFEPTTTLTLFANIIELTILFCANVVLTNLLINGCTTMVDGDYQWLREVVAELSPELLHEQHRLCDILTKKGIQCEHWTDRTVIKIGEVDDFVKYYTKH